MSDNTQAAITFQTDAYESAAMFFALLGRYPQNVTILGGTGYVVRVHPSDGSESFVAEVVDTTEVVREDGTYDAVIFQEAGTVDPRTLLIYEDIDHVEVL